MKYFNNSKNKYIGNSVKIIEKSKFDKLKNL